MTSKAAKQKQVASAQAAAVKPKERPPVCIKLGFFESTMVPIEQAHEILDRAIAEGCEFKLFRTR